MTARILAPFLGSSLVLLAACASTGRDRTRDAATRAAELRGEVVDLQRDVDATCNALKGLEASSAESNSRFVEFAGAVDDLASQIARMPEVGDELRRAGDDYVDAWGMETGSITTATLKKRSDDRRSELAKLCGEAVGAAKDSQPMAESLLREMLEIRTALDFDLTARGVATIHEDIAAALTSSARFRRQLDEVVSRVDALGRALSTTAPPTGAPAAAN